MRIDLHSHSSASDGTQPPADVVRRARAKGLDVLALTDHDTVAGHAPAAEADHVDHDADARHHLRGLARELGLEVTGSSDDHGELTGHRLGCETTDPEVYQRLTATATGAKPIAGT